MSIPLKRVTLVWDPETDRMVEDLQQQFSLFVDNRSQLIRLVVKIVHQLVLTNGVPAVVVNHLRAVAPRRDVNTER